MGIAYSNLPDGRESGCVIIQSNVCQTYQKVISDAELCSFQSFLTSCPLFLLAELLLCVQCIVLYSGIVTVGQSNLTTIVN